MSEKKRKKEKSEPNSSPVVSKISETAKKRLIEGLLILVAAVALYLLLALLTYHSSDSSWSSTGSSAVVSNAGGVVGAWTADILLYTFGYPAYIFPILLVVFAWVIYREKRITQESGGLIVSLRVLGFLIVLCSACGLTAMTAPHEHAQLPMASGGILGAIISDMLISTFNTVGSALILSAILLVGITLFTGMSWISAMKLLWKGSLQVMHAVRQGFTEMSVWVKQAAQEKMEARREAKAVEASEAAKAPAPELTRRPEIRPTVEAFIKQEPKPIAFRDAIALKPAIKITEPKIVEDKVIEAPVPMRPTPKVSTNIESIQLEVGELPPITLLDEPQRNQVKKMTEEQLQQMSALLEQQLANYGVDAKVMGVEPGPVVTRFEIDLAPGVKVSKVSNLDKDLARSLSVSSVRVVEVIPGKSFIGLEVPNEQREFLGLREILDCPEYKQAKSPVTMALGKDISGKPIMADLAKMPHLLVAGTTGSGKSVSVNTMLLSMLFKATPKQLRIILIDPKMLELSIYQDIPHLLTPVVTDMRQASNALRWCVIEMDRRYSLMSKIGVRNLDGLNEKIEGAKKSGDPLKDPLFIPEQEGTEAPELDTLPTVVVIIDELADMMMVVGKKVEELIARIAQKARAAGIHMILATQRPSVDVITGLIKANIPSRIAFKVSSRIDSRTILDQQGAQQLLGYGDMLYMPSGAPSPMRVHGPFVSDDEIHRVAAALKKCGKPIYVDDILRDEESEAAAAANNNAEGGGNAGEGEADALYDQAVAIVVETRRASISLVQRRLRIGYNRAANLVEAMEAAGVVSSMQSNGTREVLAPESMRD